MAPSLFEASDLKAAPVVESDRLVAMDVLRGFVLLGILVMNIQSFAMPIAAYVNPIAYGDLTGANLWIWIVSHVFFDQKFMAVFSMLFGAGILLMGGRTGIDAPRLHQRRMGWLIAFGLIHAYVFWYGDILFVYGVCGLLAYLFIGEPPARLLRLAGALLVVGCLPSIGFGMSISPEDAITLRDEYWRPSADVLAREVAAYRGGFVAQSRHRVPEAFQSQTIYFLLFLLWRVLGLMLAGMALLKLDVLTGGRPAAFYARVAAAGLVAGLPLVVFGLQRNFSHGWSVEYSMYLGTLWNYWGSLGMALAYTGIVIWIWRAGRMRRVTSALAAVGRMAFTNYILQTILATLIFYGHGLGLFGSVQRTAQAAIVAAIWAVSLIVSPWWLRRYRFGPLEWAWRSLTYGGRQPMRTSRASS
ncbi:MAG: DUF418 domain-containing protein [Acidobacteriota bacterium]|nr:DUF418 domain-containing protein [Acidobacteriota bacterium]